VVRLAPPIPMARGHLVVASPELHQPDVQRTPAILGDNFSARFRFFSASSSSSAASRSHQDWRRPPPSSDPPSAHFEMTSPRNPGLRSATLACPFSNQAFTSFARVPPCAPVSACKKFPLHGVQGTSGGARQHQRHNRPELSENAASHHSLRYFPVGVQWQKDIRRQIPLVRSPILLLTCAPSSFINPI